MPSSEHDNQLALLLRVTKPLLKLRYFLGLFRNFDSLHWRLLAHRLQSLQLGECMVQLSVDQGFTP